MWHLVTETKHDTQKKTHHHRVCSKSSNTRAEPDTVWVRANMAAGRSNGAQPNRRPRF